MKKTIKMITIVAAMGIASSALAANPVGTWPSSLKINNNTTDSSTFYLQVQGTSSPITLAPIVPGSQSLPVGLVHLQCMAHINQSTGNCQVNFLKEATPNIPEGSIQINVSTGNVASSYSKVGNYNLTGYGLGVPMTDVTISGPTA